jgi:hypothetical protein
MAEHDKEDLLAQIRALREEMEGHKKIVTAIYQKVDGAAETIKDNANRIEGSTHKVVATALGRMQPEIQRTINEGMMDNREHFEAVAEKVGNKHNQEMTGLWRFLPMTNILTSLLVGLAGAALACFLTPRIDDDMAARLQAGAAIMKAWPGLDKSEQNKITALAQGKDMGKPDKKSKKI